MDPPDLNGTSRKRPNLLSLHQISLVFTSYCILKSITWRTTLWEDSSPPLSHDLSFTCAWESLSPDCFRLTILHLLYHPQPGHWRLWEKITWLWATDGPRVHTGFHSCPPVSLSALSSSRSETISNTPHLPQNSVSAPAISPTALICSFTLQGK